MSSGQFSLIFIYIFAVGVIWERVTNTFSNRSRYILYKTPKENLLCTAMVLLYTGIFFVAFSALYLGATIPGDSMTGALGAFLWGLGVWYRRSSIRALGRTWCIYRTPNHLKRIITLGPFEYSRHPYYCASMLELWGYGLIFQSAPALCVATLVYLPLIYWRSLQEEKMLLERFPKEYAAYKSETPLIFNFKKAIGQVRLLNHIRQIVRLVSRYGFGRVLDILSMNRAVKRYFRNFIICQCLIALGKSGVLDEMISEGLVDIREFSDSKNLDYQTLKTICDYLYVIGVTNKQNQKYSLTGYGHDLCTVSRGVFNFIHAYSPIFENLDAILMKQKKYGVDFDRRGEFVGRASAELAELFPFPISRGILKKYGFKTILDLGSGSGDFLIGFCKSSDIKAYGVDLSPEAVAYANLKAREQKVADRVMFKVGDITKPDTFKDIDPKIDLVTSMFVLHEFLSMSEEMVINIFNSIKQAYPGRHILICELTKCSLEYLKANPSAVAEHHAFHALSQQGLADADRWRRIFAKAGLQVVEEERLDLAEQSIFLVK